CLSGTPVENRLEDLWSQFHFINPGLLGTREFFINNYSSPIASGDQEAAFRLKSKIKLFMLRRLKKEVALELPPRTELLLHCELNAEERESYESLLASTRSEVLQEFENIGGIMKALELILRLRQACCHSALLPGFQNNQFLSSKL